MASPLSSETAAFVDAQVESFMRVRPLYLALEKAIRHALEHGVAELGLVEAIVGARTKKLPSFAEKCIRKRTKYRQPVHQLTDLCGGRIIVGSRDVLPEVCAYIRRVFDIDEANSEDTVARLGDTQFGYRSVHFVVSLRSGVGLYGPDVPAELFEQRTAEQGREQGLPMGPVYKAEIQVRTLLQHAWASLLHDRLYKHDRQSTPAELVRESGRIAAALENADESLVALTARLDSYASCFGAYLSRDGMKEEIDVLRGTLRHDPRNEQLALRIANLELARDAPAAAHEVLGAFAPSTEVAVHRVLGRAYWKAGNLEKAHEHLARAVKLRPGNADARCELGDFYFASAATRHLADEQYGAAYRAAPASVRALLGYLLTELTHARVPSVAAARPSLLEAIRTSEALVSVGIHLPQGHFDIGVCNLLLGNPYEALTAIAKGSEVAGSDEPLSDLLTLLTVVETQTAGHEPLVRHVRWARGLLRALLVARAYTRLRRANEARISAENAVVAAELGGDPKVVEAARRRREEAQARFAVEEQGPRRACRALLVHPGGSTRVGEEDPTAAGLEESILAALTGARVVVVAGGCDPAVEPHVIAYAPLVRHALRGYHGVVVSGGTRAGVARIVGDLESRDGLVKIAYLPAKVPSKAPADRKYDKATGRATGYDHFRMTQENDYSPFEAIQLWLDLLRVGTDPAEVCVVGINGGRHAAFEYRLALAMGARACVLRDSGREASKIADDPRWRLAQGLYLIPTDEEVLAAFVQPLGPSGLLDAATRESMAERAHEEFRRSEQQRSAESDPRVAPWSKLTDALRQSNYAQVDDIERKLGRLGLALRAKRRDEIVLYEFSPEQVAELARMEHGRWTAERLQAGWRLGSPKDVVRRINPWLIAWDALPPEERQKDVMAVRTIPSTLRDHASLEVYAPEGGNGES